MDIVLTGRHIQIKQKFRDVVESKMNRVTAIAPDAQRVQIVLSHEGNPRMHDTAIRVELTVIAGSTVVRAEASSADEISAPPFLLNTRNRTLEKNGQRVKLTQVEYSIVKLFMENPGKALSREEILDSVWGKEYFGELKIVDVNIRRLRIKIEDDTANPTYITTVWGLGYKWGA